ncbi:stage II sporulation protein E [Maledivibacter halophilus]|uniref:Stage II sporulation protein E n=1 Tax=Maledivibacter halophilus TaxID=36842 RepID=A0A1T5MSC2_9FIRM|nr:stage II sporulation protein E [Maledivibacter halophilus]SKC91140.1 stage II sporulation protein E [Maledivibacter halophilus]
MQKFNIGAIRKIGGKYGQAINILDKSFIFLGLLAFLLGRASILEGLMPFGVAFFSTVIVKDKKNFILGAIVLLGLITVETEKYRYIATMITILISSRYMIGNINFNVFKLALLSGIITFISGIIYTVFTNFYLYDLFMIGFESVVVFVFTYILSYAIPALKYNSNRKVLSNEEVICIAIVAAVAILGLSQVNIWGFSLKNILGILLTLFFAYNGGAAIGAAVGVTIGVITSMTTTTTPTIIGIYAFSGLLGGIFKDIGKIASALGIILGNSILTFYINGSTETLIQFEEILIAFVIFIITPKALSNYMAKIINSKVNSIEMDRMYSERIKKLTIKRLKEYSTAFSELAETYSLIAEKEEIIENREITNIINDIANSICLDCSMKRSCWENYFYSTYNGMMDAITLLEADGKLDKSNLPIYLKKKCLKEDKLIDKINGIYEIHKVGYKWSKKLFEMRQLVSDQFNGISSIIDDLSTEIETKVEFKKDVEDALYVAFDKERIFIDNITVLENERGKFQIDIEKKNCYKRNICEKQIISLVVKVIGRDVIKKNPGCTFNEERSCILQLVEAQRYKVNTAIAKISKNSDNISGDSYSFLNLNDNKYMIALSDGMGFGEKAAKESSATITLLEQLMEAGFSKDIVIKTINSVLMSKSLDEAFSTIDLAIIDLYTAKVEFIKSGAVASFIKRSNGDVEAVETSSLPAGIINEIYLDNKIVKLNDGDFVITMSDGVSDADKNFINKTDWLVDLLSKIDCRNPQSIADAILDAALEKSGNKIEDDMTVLVTKIWQK